LDVAASRYCRVVAAGKASAPMARAASRTFGDRIRAGVAISNVRRDVPPPFEMLTGGHPLPTIDSERAGRRAIAIAESVQQDETLLVLLSGGASALMAVPAEDITLDGKRRATEQLLRAGADIHALNTVRKHLSAIKGGWLAARAGGRCLTLAVSDVVGDDLSVIASGPTVADASTYGDALDAIRRFGGTGSYPSAVVRRLEAGARREVPETPKPGDERLQQSAAFVIGGRRDAMTGAAASATEHGYHVVVLDDAVVGESRSAAVTALHTALDRASAAPRPACVIASGETTVRVTGGGRGGRNQEFALALASDASSGGVVAASVGTDGIDGPTDAAGAVVDWTTLERARAAKLGEPAAYLHDNNAYAFFDALGDLIKTGPTNTNVGDLQVFLFT
jgi:hydroxypyruvate reductase